jgi:hypothetical protein
MSPGSFRYFQPLNNCTLSASAQLARPVSICVFSATPRTNFRPSRLPDRPTHVKNIQIAAASIGTTFDFRIGTSFDFPLMPRTIPCLTQDSMTKVFSVACRARTHGM